MTGYKVVLTLRARQDIQASIKWYNVKQKGLGKRFYQFVKQAISTLHLIPFFQVRYSEVRCLKVKRFPYLVHYVIEDDTIYILAVICTYQDPEKHWVDLK
jgi:plasmid stabilization system protein ParE